MLTVRIEVWPYGNAPAARLVGVLALANLTPRLSDCDYAAVRMDDTGLIHATTVHGHHRADGFWALLRQAATRTGRPVAPGSTHARLLARCADAGLLPVVLTSMRCPSGPPVR